MTLDILYIFVVLRHGRREVVHFEVTCSPTMEWIIQQLREAMPFGIQPRYLFRDNDRKYGYGVKSFLDRLQPPRQGLTILCPAATARGSGRFSLAQS